MKKWFPELDVLKTTAIFFIVFSHMDNYIYSNGFIALIDEYTALAGLSIFFFVSGILFSQYDQLLSSIKGVTNFYTKKFFRIYPLYWTALFTLIIIFGFLHISPGQTTPYDFSIINLFVHFLGLQGVFPNYSLQSMWFVGVIIMFYLIFPVITYLSKNFLQMLLISLLILISLGIVHILTGLISINFFAFYPVFLFGIFINKISKLPKKDFYINYLTKTLIIALILICSLLFTSKYNLVKLDFMNILLILFMMPVCYLYYRILLSFSTKNNRNLIFFSLISLSTYTIYLFQHQILAIFSSISSDLIRSTLINDSVIFLFGFSFVIIGGILIHKIEQNLFLKWKNYCVKNQNTRFRR